MKLLFDQNLSYVLVKSLADLYPNATHVGNLNLDRVDDDVVWDYAGRHDFIIVSKDSDFRQRSFLRGAPPKIIWLNTGNCSSLHVENLLRKFSAQILAFAADDLASFLELV